MPVFAEQISQSLSYSFVLKNILHLRLQNIFEVLLDEVLRNHGWH